MSKILFSMVTLLTIALGANAQTAEPTYVGEGTVGVIPNEEWEDWPAIVELDDPVEVDHYGYDSIVVKNFWGADNFHLVIVPNWDDLNSSTYHCLYWSDSNAKWISYKYSMGSTFDYVYTGLDDPYGLYIYKGDGYVYLAQL